VKLSCEAVWPLDILFCKNFSFDILKMELYVGLSLKPGVKENDF